MENVERWYFEKKFLVPNKSMERLRALLDHYFVHDPHFGTGNNHTIYYDTQNLTDYFDGINGTANRKKVRLRYYDAGKKSGPMNLEVKYKVGSMTGKFRTKIEQDNFEPQQLQQISLEKLFKHKSNKAISDVKLEYYVPKVKIEYLRKRYFCPFSGLRVNLDSHLNAQEHYPNGINPVALNNRIEGSLVEIKGTTHAYLPKSIGAIGLKNIAFSKYCFFMSSILSKTKLYPELDHTSDLGRLTGWHCYFPESNFL